jgi:hypothetical protein
MCALFLYRFVSLIPFQRQFSITGNKVEAWHAAQAALLRLAGDVEDHATLLCSLLLGWGMEAYVAYGLVSSAAVGEDVLRHHPSDPIIARGGAGGGTGHRSYCIPHYWVATFDGVEDGAVLFWEALTGQQYEVPVDKNRRILLEEGTPRHPFRFLFSLFRHDRFLLSVERAPALSLSAACADGDGDAEGDASFLKWFPAESRDAHGALAARPASFDFSNRRHWSTMHVDGWEQLSHPAGRMALLTEPETTEGPELERPVKLAACSEQTELSLESALRQQVERLRREFGLETRFDEQLARLLQVR